MKFLTPCSFRLLCALIGILSLSSCAVPVSADKKASIRKVAVANYVEPAFSRYKVGLTIFGNAMDGRLIIEELRPRMQAIVEQEAGKRFSEVVMVPNPPELPPGNALTGPLLGVGNVAARIGRETGADAVLMIIPHPYYPYGVPSYMTSSGLGLWHIGKDQAFVMCYAHTALYDGNTGKQLGSPHAYHNKVSKGIPWKDRFTDHPPAEREIILKNLLDAFRWEVTTSLTSLGF